MIELATISSIIGIASSAVGLIDKVADTYIKFRGRDYVVPQEHRASITASEDGQSLVRTEYGREVQRVTYQELMDRLTEDDLSYIKAVEKSMNTHKEVWEAAYPQLASETNPVAKAKIQKQLDAVAEDMGKDLKRILDFIEQRMQLYLDDHYLSVRDLAEGAW